jgi:hypothetical protein
MDAPEFDADFFQLPDGTVTAVIRSHWPSADDVVEVLQRSVRRDPKRAGECRRQAEAQCE